MEIEKKYLLKQLPDNLEQYPHHYIIQSYICLNPTIRLRKKEDEYFLTVKGKGHIMREEFELSIELEEYQFLLSKADYSLEKTRYYIPIGKQAGELDKYYNALQGLYTIEIEFNTIEEMAAFKPPYWFGEDISQNPLYKNTNLAKEGIPYNN